MIFDMNGEGIGIAVRKGDETLRRRIDEAKMPPEVEKEVLRELSRLERMPEMAAEYSSLRTYLDWMIEIPWNVRTDDNLSRVDSRHSGRFTEVDKPQFRSRQRRKSRRRRERPFERTGELVETIKAAIPAPARFVHGYTGPTPFAPQRSLQLDRPTHTRNGSLTVKRRSFVCFFARTEV